MTTRMTFGDLAQAGHLYFSDGYRTKRSELGDAGFRILRVADVHEDSISLDSLEFVSDERTVAIGKKAAQNGDVLLTTKGTIGRVAMVAGLNNERVVYSPQLCFFRADSGGPLLSRYLKFWFKSHEARAQMSVYSGNTDMAPYLSLRDINSMFITVPTLTEQEAIAEVLGALDDKIAANRKISDSSNALIAFQVAARLQIATPLSKAPIHFVFGEAFSGAQFSKPGQGRPLIRIRDLKSQQCQVWTTEQRPRETAVSPGDLLIGMDAEFRATRWSGPPGVLNQRVMMAESDELGHPITQIALRETLARIERSKSGTTVIHLNKSDLDREFVMLPAADDLKELRGIVDPLWARATLAEVESRTLTAVRDELLPQLMSGRITVKDAEKRVEEEV